MRVAARLLATTVGALLVLTTAPHLGAQDRRTEVRRFQWDPVVVHIAAEAPLGVELYMSVTPDHWALTWIRPDSLAAWLPQVRALEARNAAVDSTPYVGGRGGSRFRVVKGVLQGRQLYALQLAAEPSTVSLQAWLTSGYLSDLSKALEKGIVAETELDHQPPVANAFPVYEEWDVDSLPRGAVEEHFYASLPQYMVRGSAVLGFVVAADGHIVPSSVTVYDCDDPNLAKQWGRAVTAWAFVAGKRGSEPVATRIRMAFDLDKGVSYQEDNQRVIPGRP